MANKEHLAILWQGVEFWNEWRRENPDSQVDLSETDLCGEDLRKINLSKADLHKTKLIDADLQYASLHRANIRGVNLTRANLNWAGLDGADLKGSKLLNATLIKAQLYGANLRRVNLTDATLVRASLISSKLIGAKLDGVDLRLADLSKSKLNRASMIGANLLEANLAGADLSNANLIDANLQRSSLVSTCLRGTNLSGCRVFGISAWKLDIDDRTNSKELVITDQGEPVITVDNIEVAQFVYLLLHNEKIRDVIHTVSNKAVLILGRFTPERKEILDALREKLRIRGFLPIVFDFEKAEERDFTETIKVLAGMELFVIADITNPKSTPLELQATVPDYMIPFVPIIQQGEDPFAMFKDLQHKYPWMMVVRRYKNKDQLVNYLDDKIINLALKKHNKLIALRNEALKIEDIDSIGELSDGE